MRLFDPPALSYYAASVASSATLAVEGAPTHRETLRGAIRADVVVLGGGIAGCSAALHLAKRGLQVALLEARVVGYGASGRSGGQTIFGLATSQKALATEVGRDDARRLFDRRTPSIVTTTPTMFTLRSSRGISRSWPTGPVNYTKSTTTHPPAC